MITDCSFLIWSLCFFYDNWLFLLNLFLNFFMITDLFWSVGSNAEFLCVCSELCACGEISTGGNHCEYVLYVVGKHGVVELDDVEEHSECMCACLEKAGVEATVEGREDRAAWYAGVDCILNVGDGLCAAGCGAEADWLYLEWVVLSCVDYSVYYCHIVESHRDVAVGCQRSLICWRRAGRERNEREESCEE